MLSCGGVDRLARMGSSLTGTEALRGNALYRFTVPVSRGNPI
jgi:hypothetical protein